MSHSQDRLEPIETKYKGYRFRSRTEARWAVFLDSIGAEWEYEKEGYNVEGTWYLPDFWLPYESMRNEGWGFWVEIKPTPLDLQQVHLLAELARFTGHRTFAICGQPWPRKHKIYIFQHHHGGTPAKIPLVSGGEIVEVDHHKGTEFGGTGCHLYVRGDDRDFPFIEGSKIWSAPPGALERAFRAARNARFEHGEAPRPSL
jgi:hypothetical protein